ncbi:uncharacterized protein N7529_009766 [Penicillium soppii]|uniref:uncharacterized protein n=1 Tax=Penicillium soppii TaxID=69789 RepID=UPI002548AAF8|nr:uncharacterized protein N7529_009766 [Penicillium soppii]KAJ5855822.1 hypothetical protein N7529_009766 [Penicillium soppii]
MQDPKRLPAALVNPANPANPGIMRVHFPVPGAKGQGGRLILVQHRTKVPDDQRGQLRGQI